MRSMENALAQTPRRGAAGSAPTLVFDLGGVVFRWQPEAFLARLLPARAADRAAAKQLAADFFQGFGGDWAEFDRGRIEAAPLAQRIAVRLGLSPAEALRVIDAIPDELQTVPETAVLLQRLRAAGRRLVFLSNMPAPYARHLRAHRDVLTLFEHGVFSCQTGRIKPEPWLFAHAEQAFGAAASKLLLIDDLQANVDGARAAGWRALRFEGAAQCDAELVSLGLLLGNAAAC